MDCEVMTVNNYQFMFMLDYNIFYKSQQLRVLKPLKPFLMLFHVLCSDCAVTKQKHTTSGFVKYHLLHFFFT